MDKWCVQGKWMTWVEMTIDLRDEAEAAQWLAAQKGKK